MRLKHLANGIVFKILFIWEGERKRESEGAKGEGEADSLLSKEPSWGSILGPWDHDLSQKQTLNWLSHPGALQMAFLEKIFYCSFEKESEGKYK